MVATIVLSIVVVVTEGSLTGVEAAGSSVCSVIDSLEQACKNRIIKILVTEDVICLIIRNKLELELENFYYIEIFELHVAKTARIFFGGFFCNF